MLMVTKSGMDLLLEWTPPTVDIYDRPTSVVGYRIHRNTSAGFIPATSNLIATVPDGSVSGFLDPGVALDPANLYYIVIAEGSDGLVSGGGRDLPSGISDLSVVLVAPDRIRLSWSPVLVDVQGLPTLIDHYQIHSMTAPQGRASLGPATLLMDNVRDLSIELPSTDDPVYFSVLAVDNRGNLSPF